VTSSLDSRLSTLGYQACIGLEIHVELLTESKMFCGCEVAFGGEPNTRTCPVCLGHPGTLPVTNGKAIEFLTKIGLALNCSIAEFTQFHRKNYFYPDMPKDYQISQFDLPISSNGFLEVERADGSTFKVGITRVHIEEDTGKLMHASKTGRIAEADYSLVDFNRAGTPLAETVTEPDITSPEDARLFLLKLKNLILHLGVSDVNMEEGSLRVDANVSVRKIGEKQLGTKTEVKNMNSFKSLRKALAYEIERHINLLEDGDRVIQETRHWDDSTNRTTSLRSKEEAHDYRYFADPDLVPMILSRDYVDKIRASLPELPEERRKRLIEKYGLPPHDAALLAESKPYGDFFEEAAAIYDDYKVLTNWILGELTFHLKGADLEIDESAVTPKHLVELLKLIDSKIISGKMAKEVFDESFQTGKLPNVIVEEKGYKQIADTAELEEIVMAILDENPSAVEDLKAGKDRALGFIVGQVMKLTKGRANPQLVNEIIKKKTRE
jgi:aspartyl-tRNA(Asn)/glutamyl-tRNA(Gln) amidotransferase subunit B